MANIGLHGGQIFVLLELWKADGLRQVDLAARLNVAPPTINKMVKGMVDSGLVSRSRIEDDARSTRIFLTRRGDEMRETVEAQWHELEESCVAGLTEAERLILFELLTKIRNLNTGTTDEDDRS
jgi:DNA-binding MarR family transcriptional regulator